MRDSIGWRLLICDAMDTGPCARRVSMEPGADGAGGAYWVLRTCEAWELSGTSDSGIVSV